MLQLSYSAKGIVLQHLGDIVQEHDWQFKACKRFVRSGSEEAKPSPRIKASLIPPADWPFNDNVLIGPQRAIVCHYWKGSKDDFPYCNLNMQCLF